jgi:ligand-binding sensor domain-containing protein
VRQVDPMAFLRDRNGGLWIGTHPGLMHIHQGRTDLFAQLFRRRRVCGYVAGC